MTLLNFIATNNCFSLGNNFTFALFFIGKTSRMPTFTLGYKVSFIGLCFVHPSAIYWFNDFSCSRVLHILYYFVLLVMIEAKLMSTALGNARLSIMIRIYNEQRKNNKYTHIHMYKWDQSDVRWTMTSNMKIQNDKFTFVIYDIFISFLS